MNLENMEMSQQTIAVIEDNPDLSDSMVEYLNIKGYLTWKVNSAESFYKEFMTHNKTDIFIVDIGLPGENGLGIVQHLRDIFGMQHVIIITSAFGTLNDRINGLKTGADCYMVKPIDMEELTENIKAMSRRKYTTFDAMAYVNNVNLFRRISDLPNHETELRWQLNIQNWTLTSPNNKEFKLTEREYRLLHILISAQGQTITKTYIIDQILGKHIYNGNERLDLLITRLRKKTQRITNEILPIKTAHTVGYAFTALVTVVV